MAVKAAEAVAAAVASGTASVGTTPVPSGITAPVAAAFVGTSVPGLDHLKDN